MGRKYGRRAALKGARGPWSGWIRGAGDLVLGISKSTWSMGRRRRRLNAQWRPTPANPEPAITRLLHIGFQLISTNESTVRTTHDHEKRPIDSIGKWTHGIYTEKWMSWKWINSFWNENYKLLQNNTETNFWFVGSWTKLWTICIHVEEVSSVPRDIQGK